jgi:hypothetical protein
MKNVIQKPTKEENPNQSGWYDTDTGNLYYMSDQKQWSCRSEYLSEEYPQYWYKEIPVSTVVENIKTKVLGEYKKGRIVFSSVEGLQSASLEEFVNQPTEGLLYDLNRDEATVLTLINDPKWINDYAVSKVIQQLKSQLKDK